MKIIYSIHWALKKRKRQDITDDVIEYVILHSKILKDKYWEDAFNAVAVVPFTGRTLKVIYKVKSKDIYKIISAYWLD